MLNKAVFGKREVLFQPDPAKPNPPAQSPGPAAPTTAATPAQASTTQDAPPRASTADTTGSKLIVGPDIKLKGVEITDCDTLVVEGRVEAAMDSRVIQVAQGGAFTGTVSIEVAEIRGRFEGEITARERLTIYATGRVSGKIRYGHIVIEDGGELAGDVSRLTENPPRSPANAPVAREARIGAVFEGGAGSLP